MEACRKIFNRRTPQMRLHVPEENPDLIIEKDCNG